MKLIKEFKLVIVILGILIILVIVRLLNPNVFNAEAGNAIKAVQGGQNILSASQVGELNGSWLLINLGNGDGSKIIHGGKSIQIEFEHLLEKPNQKILKEANGKLILFSEDVSTASKAWVILNQLGYQNVVVLSPEENPEQLKYKFQPDTMVRLEQDSM